MLDDYLAKNAVLTEYQNGNCYVRLFADGRKQRLMPCLPAEAAFPESIDLKITDYCDAGCAYCHESSTKSGKHAKFADIMACVDGLPKGIEIAIGGGDPMSHPDLIDILDAFRSRGLISNITINQAHITYDNIALIHMAQEDQMLYGVGISVLENGIIEWMMDGATRLNEIVDDNYKVIEKRRDIPIPRNIVHHVIAGIKEPSKYRGSRDALLVLGYKRFGFGAKCNEAKVNANLERWRYWLRTIIESSKKPVAFDNLALEQLDVRRIIGEELWSKHYMGCDGSFTMYIDAVRREYAASSTSSRLPIQLQTAREMFQSLQH